MRLLPSFILIEYAGSYFLTESIFGSYEPHPGTLVFGLNGFIFSPIKNLGFSISNAFDLV